MTPSPSDAGTVAREGARVESARVIERNVGARETPCRGGVATSAWSTVDADVDEPELRQSNGQAGRARSKDGIDITDEHALDGDAIGR
jgi:hypothetical protein